MKPQLLRNLYFGALLTYSFVGGVIVGGGIISTICIVLMTFVGLVCLYKSFFYKKNLFFVAWTLLLLLNTMWFLFTADMSNTAFLNPYKETLLLALSFYVAFYLSKKQVLSHKILLFCILVYAVAGYFTYINTLATQSAIFENVTNNSAYLFVSVLPFVFLIPSKKIIIHTIYVFICTFLIIQGAKRGAIVCATIIVIFWLYYLIIYKKENIKNLIILLIACIIIGFVLKQFVLSNEYLIKRLESTLEGNYSDRENIYSNLWTSWLNRVDDNFFSFLFGKSYYASYAIFGIYAHNDWLELLFDFGLLGGIIYVLVILGGCKMVLDKKNTFERKYVIMVIMFVWISMSTFSMFYPTLSNIPLMILLTYMYASPQNKAISKQ